tara:strand:- start:1533 stop:3791 length:2259 start_codon:yes stop_codon:yes gene_type:complete
MKIIVLLFLALSFSTISFSQIIIDDTPTATQLVTNTLIGQGLITSNITFSGSPSQIGFFNGMASNIGLDSGVVMSSGAVSTIAPPGIPNTTVGGPGDADVLATAQSVTSNPFSGDITSTNDAAVLEFDFVPNGDVVIFRFVFASEEYLTYVNTQFNDAFGFYISGPNPAGGNYIAENLALVPGTTEPITISTIHPGLNSQYYIDDPAGTTQSFNGFTVPIEIEFNVICDSTYHFKFAVADCVDGILDTGVLLEGGSFEALPVDLNLETNLELGQFGDSVIFEGCGTDANFVFTRPSCQSSDSLYVNIAITGTATNGVDYSTVPDSVLFLPDSTSIAIPFFAYQDGIFEGFESVFLEVTNILASGDTIITAGVVWLFDQPNVNVQAQDTSIFCHQDSVEIFALGFDGVEPYNFSWEGFPDTTSSIYVPTDINGTIDYIVTITDFCGFVDIDTLTVIVNQTLIIDSVTSLPSSFVQSPNCPPTGVVQAYVSGQTSILNQTDYSWTGPGNPGAYNINGTSMGDIPPGWYYFTVTDDVCSQNDSIEVGSLPPPMANFTASVLQGCNPLTVVFTNTSEETVTYDWDFGNGSVLTNVDASDQSQVYTSNSSVTLTAYDENMCFDEMTQFISIVQCGCTDQAALNYDPLAIQEDGSCVYPMPVVIAPNVFTPNNDGGNDKYFFETIYAVRIEVLITNRWGNVVYDESIDLTSSSLQEGWDGITPSGLEANEGTYFYKYIATGIDGTKIDGHGFLQLVRN